MMLASPTSFPEWLPPAVALEAQRILDTESADAALVHRLAMDKRMKLVWRELSKLEMRPQLEDSILDVRAPLGDHLTDQEAALVLLFWYAYFFARFPTTVATLSEHDALLASCEDTAKKLRDAAVALRELPNKLSRCEVLQIGDLSPQFGDIFAKGVEEAAQFCDEAVAEIINQKAIDPLVVDRPGHHRAARGYVLNLAGQISKPLYGTLATIASVALNCSVTKQQVIDWTRGVIDWTHGVKAS
jgi:hypothetical protein